MSTVQALRRVINERLTVAVEDILGVFQKTIVEYEEEIGRQRRLLDVLLKPEISLHRIAPVWPDSDLQLRIPEGSLALGQGDSDTRQVKEERPLELPTPPPPRVGEHLAAQHLQPRGQARSSTWGQEDPDGPRFDETAGGREGERFPKEPDVFKPTWNLTCGEGAGGERSPAWRLHRTQREEEEERMASAPFGRVKAEAPTEPTGERPSLEAAREMREDSSEATGGADLPAHRKTKRCDVCHKEFCDGTNLKTHMRTHTGERPFACIACGKTFIQSSDLKRHMITHTGETPFWCRVCGRGFRSGWNLKMHTRTHTGEKPNACGLCGKGFRRSEQLKRHVQEHAGEGGPCGKAFFDGSSFGRQLRAHAGERPCRCTVCGKAFAVSASLKMHARIHTREAPTAGQC